MNWEEICTCEELETIVHTDEHGIIWTQVGHDDGCPCLRLDPEVTLVFPET